MAESLLTYDFNIIFTILLLLPTKTLLQVQTVCRAWARVISNPAFVQAHCSRPSLITAAFTPKGQIFGGRIQTLATFQESDKFPTTIWSILSRGYEVVSRSHGVLCFRRGRIFLVGNPATSHWSIARYPTPTYASDRESYWYNGVVLLYNPAMSFSFKLAVALIKFDDKEEGKYYIKFNIYSPETGSWAVSSVFTQWWNPQRGHFNKRRIMHYAQYEPCKIGTGSVCWTDAFGFLVGYEIATDTFWKTLLPPSFHGAISEHMSSYDGTIHFTRRNWGIAKVWRLETKDRWIPEAEGGSNELCYIFPRWIVYDSTRKAMLIGDQMRRTLFAFHFSGSRLGILYQGLQFPEDVFFWDGFDSPPVAHGNTLARFDGEFHLAGASLLDLLHEMKC